MNDLVTIQEDSSLPFGARSRRLRIQRNGYLQKCEIFLKTYHSMIDHHGPKIFILIMDTALSKIYVRLLTNSYRRAKPCVSYSAELTV